MVEVLCPETGTIDYSGVIGTNLWVVPKELPTIANMELFTNNYARVDFVTKYFDIGQYIKLNDDKLWSATMSTSYYFFTGNTFDYGAYIQSLSENKANLPSAAIEVS
jgi:hypothetical protein